MTVAVYAGCVDPDALRLSVELRDYRGRATDYKKLSVAIPRGKGLSCWDALMPEVLKALKCKSLEEAQKHHDFSIVSGIYVETDLAAKLGHHCHSVVLAELSDRGHVTRTFKASHIQSDW